MREADRWPTLDRKRARAASSRCCWRRSRPARRSRAAAAAASCRILRSSAPTGARPPSPTCSRARNCWPSLPPARSSTADGRRRAGARGGRVRRGRDGPDRAARHVRTSVLRRRRDVQDARGAEGRRFDFRLGRRSGLSAQPIRSIERVRARTRVYNLQTDAPHTYFASGIAVHNKGGGGGCFPAGTRISTPSGSAAIETLRPGDIVLSVGPDLRAVDSPVEAIHLAFTPITVVRTTAGELKTTAEHPLMMRDGAFRPAGELKPGDQSAFSAPAASRPPRSSNAARPARRARCSTCASARRTRSSPTASWSTTRAAVAAVRRRRFHGGGSAAAQTWPGWPTWTTRSWSASCSALSSASFWCLIVVKSDKLQGARREPGLLVQPLRDCEQGGQDSEAAGVHREERPEVRAGPAGGARRAPRSCCSRNAGRRAITTPMKPLLMPDLYAEHLAQIQGMIRNHEINCIEGLSVEAVDLVNVRYPNDAERARVHRAHHRQRARTTTWTTGRSDFAARRRGAGAVPGVLDVPPRGRAVAAARDRADEGVRRAQDGQLLRAVHRPRRAAGLRGSGRPRRAGRAVGRGRRRN